MATETFPALQDTSGIPYGQDTSGLGFLLTPYYNMAPIKLKENEWGLIQRPEFKTHEEGHVSSSTRGRGIITWGSGNNPIFIASNTYYYGATPSTAGLDVGTTNTTYKAFFTFYNQGGSDRLVIVNPGTSVSLDGNIYYSTSPTGAPTKVSDADAPGNNGEFVAGGGASLNGYFFVGTDQGNIYNCDLDDITSWQATSVVNTEREADPITYVGKHHNHIVAIGSRSTEFFYDSGSASGSPLQRREDISYNIGSTFINTFIESGDILYFVGTSDLGLVRLYKLENFRITDITTTSMSYILNKFEYNITSGYGYEQEPAMALVNSGLSGLFLVLTVNTSLLTGTWAHHLETSTMYKWHHGSDADFDVRYGTDWDGEEIMPVVATTQMRSDSQSNDSNEIDNKAILSNGRVVYITSDLNENLQEEGAASVYAPVYFYTDFIDFDTNDRKRFNSFSLLFNFPASFGTSEANDYLAWVDPDTLLAGLGQDLDEASFTNNVQAPQTALGARTTWHRLGSSRKRIFKARLRTGEHWILKGYKIDYDLLRG